MLSVLFLVVRLLMGAPPGQVLPVLRVGLATTFYVRDAQGRPDPWNPDTHLACRLGHRTRRRLNDDLDMIVAHRTLPCGTRLWIYNPESRRSVVAVVGDRGPRHADLDLAPRVKKLLRHNGYAKVLFVVLDQKR